MSATQDPLLELQDKLILAILANIPFDGWSLAAIEAGARSLGLDPVDGARCFPRGVRDAMAHFSDWADRGVVEAIHAAGDDYRTLKIREKITFGVRARLDLLEPHKDAVRAMTANFGLPSNARLAARLVWKTADVLWCEAGDTATDYNHYTKRGLLSGVQVSTSLFWLGDTSDGHQRTWEFLDRRIANVLVVGKQLGRFKNFGEHLPDLSGVLKWAPFSRRQSSHDTDPNGEPSAPTVH